MPLEPALRPKRSPNSRNGSTTLEPAPTATVNGKGGDGDAARLKELVDSYLRQLYSGSTATRALAAQALGALPSFLPAGRAGDALRLAVELGAVGSLTDVLTADNEMPIQEACLLALSSLLLATAPHEDHSAPLRPKHLKLLGALLLRHDLMAQIGYLLANTSNGRVVLAAARLVAIVAPYITRSNDVYVLDSRIVPALLAAVAARPDPAGGGGGGRRVGGGASSAAAAAGPAGPAPAPRDAAACILALLTLAQTTPDLYDAVHTAEFLQAISVLYERCIAPDQSSDVLLPADAAALLLRAVALTPPDGGGGGDGRGSPGSKLVASRLRAMERKLEESDVLGCLVSYVAVEAAALRRVGEQLAEAAEGNAEAVVDRNGSELKQLQSEMQERRQQLAEARVAAQGAARRLTVAEAEAARAQQRVDIALAAGGGVGGGTAAQRQARREAEAEAAAAEAAAEAAAADADAAEAAVGELRGEVAAVRRSEAPLRWQKERLARLAAEMKSWRQQYGFKTPSRVKLSRPNMNMLAKVLAFLSSRVQPAPAPERGAATATAGGSSPRAISPVRLPAGPLPAAAAAGGGFPPVSARHAAVVQARLLEAGLVQAVLQLHTVLSGLRSLAAALAGLAGDCALQHDMAAALRDARSALGREAEGLLGINFRAERRLRQIHSEAARLRKALRLDLPLPEGSPQTAAVELGPGNGLSRGVRQEDVRRRLEALDSEAADLEAALGDSEALVEFLQDRIQAITAASSALTVSYARFLRAFPDQAAPATPTLAPASAAPAAAAPSASNGHPHPHPHAAHHHIHGSGAVKERDKGPSGPRHQNLQNQNPQQQQQQPAPPGALRLASHSILAKDPSHPAGHLLGLLSRALAPVTRGSVLNLPVLVRQLLGRLPATEGGASAAVASWPYSSLNGGGGGGGVTASPARPASATSLEQTAAERSQTSGVGSPRASGLYGNAFGGLLLSGPGPFPAAADAGAGRQVHPPSPPRSLSISHNGSWLALRLIREKGAAAAVVAARNSSAHSSTAGAGGAGAGFPLVRVSHAWPGKAAAAAAAPPPPGLDNITASVSMPLAEESRRVLYQVASSVFFDSVGAGVLGPGVVRASSSSLPAATASARQSVTLPLADRIGSGVDEAADGGDGAAGGGGNDGGSGNDGDGGDGGGGSDVSVLDALLMQSSLLCEVVEALATLQQFARSTCRTCHQLPATVSYASIAPGSLGPYMARLHGVWAAAVPRHPDLRVPIAEAVTEIAQLALVPGPDFRAVYLESGLVGVLVRMLAGGLRPPAAGGAGARGGGQAVTPGSGPGGGSGGGTGLAPGRRRHAGRPTAAAPPPLLRLGPAQQAEQAAAGRALRAISQAQSEVLADLGSDEQLLTRLSRLALDHSASWAARQSAAELLGDMVLGGGPGAVAAVAAGAYAGLVESVNRDMYPYMNQDPRGSKETVVSALGCLAAHPELLEGVVAAAQAPHGPSSGLPLGSCEAVRSAILRSLWGVCWQVYTAYKTDRTGRGRHLDHELASALMATAATAARELAVLADTMPEARRVMIGELGLQSKISAAFLQAIKNPALNEALLELRKNLF